jgi:hypothetical protein
MTTSETQPAPDAGAEGHELAGGPAALAANAALLSLSRAARSFTLYDPANKVVRQLIGDFREKFARALETHGALTFEVHPFELALGKDVVYVEKDRERSLAFRLFRDGVRRLGFAREVAWEELLRLLEILSIRFTGVRQQEDDFVTLLRKAGFRGISVTAIEGFVPEEEQVEESVEGATRQARLAHFDLPRDFDLPLPPFPEATGIGYRMIAPAALEALRAEEEPEVLPSHALRAAAALLREAGSAAEREAALAFAAEVRDFLVVEGRADVLSELARLVAAPGFVDAKTLRALVLAQPPDTEAVPPDLAAMLETAGGDVLALALDLLAAEGDGPRAPFLRRLAAHAARGAMGALEEAIRQGDGPMAAALLPVLAEIDAKAALALALERANQGEPPVQLAAITLIGAAAPEPAHLSMLRHLTTAETEAVRVRAFTLLAERAGPRVAPLLRAHVESHAAGLSVAEAEAAGLAMARAAPKPALEAFTAWLQPKGGGLLGRLVASTAPVPVQHAVVAGLAALTGPEAEALLAQLAERGDTSVRAQAADQLAARRRGAGATTGGGAHG